MEINIWQVLLSFFGSIIGGGMIVAWIEFQRLRREKEEWKLKDKKIDIKILSVEANENRWNPTIYKDEKKKLSIYEKGLNDKVSDWMFIIKIAYSNLTDRDILVTMAELEIPMPNYEVAKIEGTKQERFYPIKITKYDLMKKTLINEYSFPLVIPQKSTAGIVFLGNWNFNYPYLVNSVPSSSSLIIKLDDGINRQINIDFSKAGDIMELAYSSSGNPHWEPALNKSKEEIEKAELDEIPF